MTTAFEINFDGLVGPTHNYSALSWGNVASMGSQAHVQGSVVRGSEFCLMATP
jgi:succinylarginine dihydrolase